MDARTHLALCESVAQATDRMLAAAQRADWDGLVVAERECATLVERLRSARTPPALGAAEGARKAALIRHMLANDKAIRDLTRPELARLASLIAPAQREARVHRAYGAGGRTPP